jgi:hypothetical protein
MQRRRWHSIDGGTFPILGQPDPACVMDALETFRTITTDTRQNDADGAGSKPRRDAAKEWISRRAHSPHRWTLIQAETQGGRGRINPHVVIAGCHVCRIGKERHAIFGFHNSEAAP